MSSSRYSRLKHRVRGYLKKLHSKARASNRARKQYNRAYRAWRSHVGG